MVLHSPLPAGANAAVMGTGIVSVGLSLTGFETLSRVLLGLALAGWLTLAPLLVLRLTGRAQGSPEELADAAATAVLGVRFFLLGRHGLALGALGLAVLVWLRLAPRVLRRLWRQRLAGTAFMLVVATEGLAVLAAELAPREHATWLELAAVVLLLAGVLAYALVLANFQPRELLEARGDHWIAGGTLAIAALACASAAAADRSLRLPAPTHHALALGALVLWIGAAAWLPVLLVAEAVARRVDYDANRWSTVFPVGMYAVSTLAVGDVEDWRWPTRFVHVWIWVAVAVWTLVAAGTARRVSGL
jgi:tellurite resistance protein TehA-like permease